MFGNKTPNTNENPQRFYSQLKCLQKKMSSGCSEVFKRINFFLFGKVDTCPWFYIHLLFISISEWVERRGNSINMRTFLPSYSFLTKMSRKWKAFDWKKMKNPLKKRLKYDYSSIFIFILEIKNDSFKSIVLNFYGGGSRGSSEIKNLISNF